MALGMALGEEDDAWYRLILLAPMAEGTVAAKAPSVLP